MLSWSLGSTQFKSDRQSYLRAWWTRSFPRTAAPGSRRASRWCGARGPARGSTTAAPTCFPEPWSGCRAGSPQTWWSTGTESGCSGSSRSRSDPRLRDDAAERTQRSGVSVFVFPLRVWWFSIVFTTVHCTATNRPRSDVERNFHIAFALAMRKAQSRKIYAPARIWICRYPCHIRCPWPSWMCCTQTVIRIGWRRRICCGRFRAPRLSFDWTDLVTSQETTCSSSWFGPNQSAPPFPVVARRKGEIIAALWYFNSLSQYSDFPCAGTIEFITEVLLQHMFLEIPVQFGSTPLVCRSDHTNQKLRFLSSFFETTRILCARFDGKSSDWDIFLLGRLYVSSMKSIEVCVCHWWCSESQIEEVKRHKRLCALLYLDDEFVLQV